MKIRSLLELNDFLSGELSWRKQELTAVELMLHRLKDHERIVLLRAAICLLYAHWEGFVKLAATSYVTYVSNKGLKYCELSPNFVALGLRERIKVSGRSNRHYLHTDLVSFLMSDLNGLADLSPVTAIDTASNLKFDVFEEVLCVLGLDKGKYLTHKALIDERLLKNRNNIAHGQPIEVEEKEYRELYQRVLKIIDTFRDQIEDSAACNAYLRQKVIR
jgi:hypothetical protein